MPMAVAGDALDRSLLNPLGTQAYISPKHHFQMTRRFLMLSVLAAFAGAVSAQSAPFYFYQAEEAINRSQLKLMISAVMDVDPQADVFHSDDMTIIQVKAASNLPAETYREALVNAGVRLRAGMLSPEQVHAANAVEAPPIFIATGDAAGDLARYQQAVQAWNANHPDNQLSPTPVHLR